MNIPKQKRFAKIIIIFLSVISCTNSYHSHRIYKISTIFEAIEVKTFEESYIYSANSLDSISGKYYSLRSKAHYANDGLLDSLLIFKPEGELLYTTIELQSDSDILKSLELPLRQNYRLQGDTLLIGFADTIRVKLIDKGSLIFVDSKKKANLNRFYKLL